MYVFIFYFLLIKTLMKLYDKNDIQHIIDIKQGIINIIKYQGDISKIILLLLSFV